MPLFGRGNDPTNGGVDSNVQDNTGNTPLHLAAKMNNKHTARFLIEHGAEKSLQVKNSNGKLPVGTKEVL